MRRRDHFCVVLVDMLQVETRSKLCLPMPAKIKNKNRNLKHLATIQYCLYDLVTAATRKEPAEKQTSQTTNLYLWLKQGIGWQRDWVDTTITVTGRKTAIFS